MRRAQGPWTSLELHTLGWKAFQDLCSQVCEEILKSPVSIYREAQDGGQDAVFLIEGTDGVKTGSVQCKFTSKEKRLKVSDLTQEEESISELVQLGQADTYVFLTNMGIDAPIAAKIKKRLISLGVRKPHVFGKEFLTRSIKSSLRLRALVPRVYGLGDLSIILDERKSEQAKALLGHLAEGLRVYVPTEPHQKAIQSLSDHGIVLLSGAPATGKTTIATILAMTSLEGGDHEVFKCDGPLELIANWNPHESGKFYWIDDAFGPNQLNSDFVGQWISIMPKLRTALALGNRFVLTSRQHIYEAAKLKLGSRNHPLLNSGEAIVEVGGLSLDERRQILYNHIKMGQQPAEWKSAIQPHLEEVAAEQTLTPEIARRLGDPEYTTNITTKKVDILGFVRSPKEHLVQVINEMSPAHQAALVLIYIHRGRLPVGSDSNSDTWDIVSDTYGVNKAALGDSLQELENSFIIKFLEQGRLYRAFKHPTITDAMSEILRHRAELTQLYLRGANWEDLLSTVACTGSTKIQDSLLIQEDQNILLAERFQEIPDELNANERLYRFLGSRASENFFRILLKKQPFLFRRTPEHDCWWQISWDARINAMAKANEFGLLTAEFKTFAANKVMNSFFDHVDPTCIRDEYLAFFEPLKLLKFAFSIRNFLSKLEDEAEVIVDNADPDDDAPESFSNFRGTIRQLDSLFQEVDDMEALELLQEAEAAMESGIESIRSKETFHSESWQDEDIPPNIPNPIRSSRSIFSDVAE